MNKQLIRLTFLSLLLIMLAPVSMSAKTYMGTINIEVGEEYYVSHGYESNGYTVSGYWTKTNGSAFVITASSSGSGGCRIKGNQVGTSTLNWTGVVSAGWSVWDVEYYWTVNVTAPQPVPVNNITLNKTSLSLMVRQEDILTATISPSNATNQSVTWSIDDNNVATVNQWGIVKAKTEGNATITCKANDGSGVTATCSLKVEGELPEPEKGSVKQVVAGWKSSWVLMEDGTLWACGFNEYGKLGDGTTSNFSKFKLIMSGVEFVSAGYNHTMILKEDGTLWACGQNNHGQLGDGSKTDRSTPKQIMTDVASVAAGGWHTLILKSDGTLWACGNNNNGQLGDGTTTDRSSPKKVTDGVAKISAGITHSLLIKTDGTLWGVGSDDFGALAQASILSSTTYITYPKQLMVGVADVAAGSNYTEILKVDGTLWACGDGGYGGLGTGSTATYNQTPKQVTSNVSKVSVFDSHTMILKKDGSLWACGWNYKGALGDGTTTNRSTPVQVMTDVSDVSAGGLHTIIVKKDGTIWTCGSNEYGGLGDSTKNDRYTPVNIEIDIFSLVSSVTLNKTTLSMQASQEEVLEATVKPDNAKDKTVTWTSSNTSVATVDSNGKVTAISSGSATITCTANDGSGKKATCTVTVTVPVNSISLNYTSLSLVKEDTRQLRATVTPSNATDKTVKWTSSNTSIATVDDDGKVTAKAKGNATITCTANDGSGVQATCDVTVFSVKPWSTFTAKTAEGIEMKFYSRDDGTCYVYGYSWSPAIDVNTTGPVTIPSEAEGLKVTSIYYNSFYNCKGITKVTIPNTMESIGNSAFHGCSSLETVVLGNGLKSLEYSVFYDCTSLNSITGISQLEYIGNNVFYNTPWYNSLPDGLVYLGKVLYKYKGTMPDNTTVSVNDGVKMISSSAFSSCKGLVGISIPQSVETIEDGSIFNGCTNLKTINVASGNAKFDSRNNCNAIIDKEKNILIAGCTGSSIPSTVTAIGYYAFYGSGIEELIIPNNVDSIASWAFGYCSSLKTVSIGKGLKVIGNYAFSNCSALQSITVVSGNPYFDSRDNCNAIIEKSTDKLIVGCTTTVIPQSVKTIGKEAFRNNVYAYSITIPDQVEKIEEYAFAYNYNPRMLTIGRGVKEIDKSAFIGCNALRSIHVLSQEPLEIDETVFKSNYTYFPDSIYNNAILYVPTGAKINYMTTPCWNKFKHIVETDGQSPCEGDLLEPDGSPLVFAVTSTSGKTCEVIGVKSSAAGRISIPTQAEGCSVDGIGYDAFYNMKGITHIDIPTSVTYLDDYALYYCSDIESVELPSSLERIGYFALGGLAKVNNIVIPKSVVDIDRGIFTADSMLTSITVEAGNPVYDSRGGCNAVMETAMNRLVAGVHTSVIPQETKTIGYFAFNSQKKLKEVNIPQGVTCIDEYAFNNCGLQRVTIPASVDSIGQWAFRYCRDLSEVTSLIENPSAINENVFQTNYINSEYQFTSATLYVPIGCKGKYQAAEGWNKFKNIIEKEVAPSVKGDVNEDKAVNGTDLVALTNIILGKSAEKPSADVNGDGQVNGTDYVALANIILGKANAPRMTADDTAAGGTIMGGTATLQIEPFDIRPGETREMAVSLSNPDDALTLLQFDLQLPQGLTVEKEADGLVTEMAGRTSSNSHQLCTHGNGSKVRFLLASADNELIDASEGAVVYIKVTADASFNGGIITLHDILGVSPNEQEVTIPNRQYSIAGETNGIYSISDAQKGAAVYSLAGQRLHSVQKGINIINGKKVIKK